MVPRALWVNGQFSNIVWIPMSDNAAAGQAAGNAAQQPVPAIDPRVLAEQVLQQIGLPEGQVQANPVVGLVAVPAWFWVDGVWARTGSASLEGTTIDVQISPERYHWTFGDGASLDTNSPGQAYPAESDVRHTYEASSFRVGGAFATDVSVQFRARFRVNGGDWQDLGTLQRTYDAKYVVQQLQAVAGKARP
jgi:hypothetical protein